MVETTRDFLDSEDETPESPVPEDTGEDYALVIGVNDYPKVRSLQGAIADARAFADWLASADGGRLPGANVRTIVSTQEPLAPIGHEINDALEDILERANKTGGRRFYFYFSGHGCVGDRASDISLCLANWSELRRRAALSSDAWLDVVVRSGAFAEVAFFLDCCRVWAARAVGLPPHIDFARPVEREEPTRVFVAYATEFQRVAVESSRDESDGVRGNFTRALLRGLSGYAANDDNGVTAEDLKNYLERQVRGRAHRAEVQNGFRQDTRFGFAVRPPEQPPGPIAGRPDSRVFSIRFVPYFEGAADFEVVSLWQRLLSMVATGLNPLPEVTWNHSGKSEALCRVIIVLFDGALSGMGWSVHGSEVDIPLNRTSTWIDVHSRLSVFSARLAPGAYVLRWNGARDFAFRVHAGFDTRLLLMTEVGPPRIQWVPWVNSACPPPFVRIADCFEWEVAETNSASDEGSSRISKIMDGDSFDEPALGLLAGYRLCQAAAPNPARIEAIASHIESLLGPAPDVHALRLRAAMMRGANLPSEVCREPPVFREGLLAFIDASQILPEIIEPGSLLEYACVHRFVDASLSSWPNPDRSRPVDADWLTMAIAELAVEQLDRGKTIDVQTMAKELGVPPLAVRTRMRENHEEYIAILNRIEESDRRGGHESTAMADHVAKNAEMRAFILRRDYQGALAILEARVAAEPHTQWRRTYRICLEKATPTSFLVPRIVVGHEKLASLDLDVESKKLLERMSEELPVHDFMLLADMTRMNAALRLEELLQRGIIEIVRVLAKRV